MPILYRDIPHTYEDSSTGDKYMSGTTFLKRYACDKDWDAIRTKYANKYNKQQKKETGVDPKTDSAYWEAEWKRLSDIACEKGTKLHLQLEHSVMDQYPDLPKYLSPEGPGEEEKLSLDTLKLGTGLYPELIVWNNKAMIAGQADLVKVKDGVVFLMDYKSNAKIDIEPYVRWDGTFDRMKAPINHIPDTKGEGYFLQLNLYMYMILKHNPKLSMGDMIIRHFHFDEDDKPTHYTDIKCPDYQKEIKDLINHRADELLFE